MLLRDRNAARFLFVVFMLALGLGVYYQSDLWNAKDLIPPVHTLLIGAACSGFLFSDPLAKFFLRWTPIGLLSVLLASIAMTHAKPTFISERLIVMYTASLTVMAIAIWFIRRQSTWKITAVASGAFVSSSWVVSTLQSIETRISGHALTMLSIGFSCFALGAVVSAFKGGLGHQIIDAAKRERRVLLYEWLESGGAIWFRRAKRKQPVEVVTETEDRSTETDRSVSTEVGGDDETPTG